MADRITRHWDMDLQAFVDAKLDEHFRTFDSDIVAQYGLTRNRHGESDETVVEEIGAVREQTDTIHQTSLMMDRIHRSLQVEMDARSVLAERQIAALLQLSKSTSEDLDQTRADLNASDRQLQTFFHNQSNLEQELLSQRQLFQHLQASIETEKIWRMQAENQMNEMKQMIASWKDAESYQSQIDELARERQLTKRQVEASVEQINDTLRKEIANVYEQVNAMKNMVHEATVHDATQTVSSSVYQRDEQEAAMHEQLDLFRENMKSSIEELITNKTQCLRLELQTLSSDTSKSIYELEGKLRAEVASASTENGARIRAIETNIETKIEKQLEMQKTQVNNKLLEMQKSLLLELEEKATEWKAKYSGLLETQKSISSAVEEKAMELKAKYSGLQELLETEKLDRKRNVDTCLDTIQENRRSLETQLETKWREEKEGRIESIDKVMNEINSRIRDILTSLLHNHKSEMETLVTFSKQQVDGHLDSVFSKLKSISNTVQEISEVVDTGKMSSTTAEIQESGNTAKIEEMFANILSQMQSQWSTQLQMQTQMTGHSEASRAMLSSDRHIPQLPPPDPTAINGTEKDKSIKEINQVKPLAGNEEQGSLPSNRVHIKVDPVLTPLSTTASRTDRSSNNHTWKQEDLLTKAINGIPAHHNEVVKNKSETSEAPNKTVVSRPMSVTSDISHPDLKAHVKTSSESPQSALQRILGQNVENESKHAQEKHEEAPINREAEDTEILVSSGTKADIESSDEEPDASSSVDENEVTTEPTLKCTYCDFDMPRSEHAAHEHMCGSTLKQCPHCLRRQKMADLQAHIDECDCRLVSCPSGCGGKFLKRGIPAHLTRCPKKQHVETDTFQRRSSAPSSAPVYQSSSNSTNQGAKPLMEPKTDDKPTMIECKFCDEEIPGSQILSHEKTCDWKPSRCQHCSMVIITRDLLRHEAMCQSTVKKCSHCHEQFTPKELTLHMPSCPKRPIKCIRCLQQFPADGIVDHAKTCAYAASSTTQPSRTSDTAVSFNSLQPARSPPPPPAYPPPSNAMSASQKKEEHEDEDHLPPDQVISEWTVGNVLSWLKDDVGLPQVAEAFERMRCTGDMLLQLTEADLMRTYGISNAAYRQHILSAIEAIKSDDELVSEDNSDEEHNDKDESPDTPLTPRPAKPLGNLPPSSALVLPLP